MATELAAPADGVHDFAQDLRVLDLFCGALAVDAGVLFLEAADFRGEDPFETVVDLAGVLQRIAIDQQRGRPRAGLAGGGVEIGEEVVDARHGGGGLAILHRRDFVAGEVFVDLLGDRRVVADHDEDGRRVVEGELVRAGGGGGVFTGQEFLFVMFVELGQCGLERLGQLRRFLAQHLALGLGAGAGGLAAGAWEVFADMFVQIAQHGQFELLRIVARGQERDLHQSGLDGLDQAEVADDPAEKRVGLVAGAGEVVRRRAQVVDGADLEPLCDAHEAVEPDGGPLVLGGGVLAFGDAVILLGQVAMVGFVVEDEQARAGPEVAEQAADQRGEVLLRLAFGAVRLDLAIERRPLVALQCARLERVVVRDDQPAVQFREGVAPAARDEVADVVVVGGVDALAWIDAQHAEAVADGEAGGDDEEVVGEARVVPVFGAVVEVVDDQCGHDDRLAGAGGHLEGEAGQVVLGGGRDLALLFEFPQNELACVRFLRDLVEPDGGFDGLALGEEELLRVVALRVQEPELEQFAGDAGGLRVAGFPPRAHLAAQQVDRMVSPFGGGRFVPFQQFALCALPDGNGLHFRRKDPAARDRLCVIQFP